MIQIKQNSESIKWPVTVFVPQSGGTYKEETFHLYFKLISIEEAQDNYFSPEGFFKSIIADFHDDIKDENDQALKFTPGNLNRLLKIPYVFIGVAEAYREFISSHSKQAKVMAQQFQIQMRSQLNKQKISLH